MGMTIKEYEKTFGVSNVDIDCLCPNCKYSGDCEIEKRNWKRDLSAIICVHFQEDINE